MTPPLPRRLVLWRHGRTVWNAIGRFQGSTDIGLDELGIAQAKHAATLLAGLGPSAIVSSDLVRAADTAAALASITGLPVTTSPGLRETYAGTWQGLTSAEIRAADGDGWAAWQAGDPTSRPGGGETRPEVAARMVRVIEPASAALPEGSTLVVVTHGGAARTVIASLMGLPEISWTSLGGLSNCCWSVLEQDRHRAGRWRLLEHNAGTLLTPVLTEEG